MGHCDDLSPEWRTVTWDNVRFRVDDYFKLTACKDDLRPVYSKVLVLDSYDSFRSMHVSLDVFVSALAKRDAEGRFAGKDEARNRQESSRTESAVHIWLENLTFETAADITSFLLDNVKECEVFERKFGHAPGCKTNPSFKKGAEVKLHSLQKDVEAAVQKAFSKLPKVSKPVVVPLAAITESKPKSRWPVHSGPTVCGRAHPEGD
jgi:hypothetical protein